MNVTFNTYSLNGNKNRYNNFYNLKQQSFTANAASSAIDAAEEILEQAAKDKSSFFKPFSDFYENFTDGIAKHFTSKVADSKALGYISDKLQNSNNLFQHCLTVGSLITSGLYMQKTLTNDKLDKDRKRTLAVNQGLTFLLSTAGAYCLDKYLKDWWENVTADYVGVQISDKNFAKDFKDIKNITNKVNKALKNDQNADMFKLAENAKKGMNISENVSSFINDTISKAVKYKDDGVKSMPKTNLDKFIKKLTKDGKIVPVSDELSTRIKGMGLLRTMLVFGFVYRFFVPVAVTKPANWLCEKYLANKKAKSAEKSNS